MHIYLYILSGSRGRCIPPISGEHSLSTTSASWIRVSRPRSSGLWKAMALANPTREFSGIETGQKSMCLMDAAQLLDTTETFIFDIDGVIWKGGKLLDRAQETLEFLRKLGKNIIFVTNNSTNSRKQVYQKFAKLGLNVCEEEIFSSSYAAAEFLQTYGFPAEKKVYIVGEEGIQKELEQVGIQSLGGPADNDKKIDVGRIENVDYDPEVGAVVVGFDRQINYYKLIYATLCLKNNPGCLFLATNLDRVANLTPSQEWPAGGCMVGAVKASTNMEPIVVGKPSSFMMDYLSSKFKVSKNQMCMVGDNLDTDILFGRSAGCKTLLVLSGVTDLETLKSPSNRIHPDFYTSQISDMLAAKY